MSKRLIVNIRGANASGKTTLMRHFIDNTVTSAQHIAPDGVKVDFQFVHAPGQLNMPVCIVGKYDDSKYSGCDKIKSADAIEWAVRYAAKTWPDHHIMFEGFRVSKSYTRYAALCNEFTNRGESYCWVFLHAPEELIHARSEARRNATSRPIDKKELSAVVRVMSNTRRNAMQIWPDKCLTLDPARSPDEVYSDLLSWMRIREQT